MKNKKRLFLALGLILSALFIFFPKISARAEGDEDETYTVTFDYGALEEALSAKNYVAGGKTYTHSVTVKAGEKLDVSDLTLPSYWETITTTIGAMNFNYWSDNNGEEVYLGYVYVEEDITLYAHYIHTVTYHAGKGHFYDHRSFEGNG